MFKFDAKANRTLTLQTDNEALKEESKFKATISFIISPSYSTAGSLRERERERERERKKIIEVNAISISKEVNSPFNKREQSTPKSDHFAESAGH